MFCNNCGKELYDNESICQECGFNVSEQWSDEDDNTLSSEGEEINFETPIEAYSDNAERNHFAVTVAKIKKILILAIIAVALVSWYGTNTGKLTTARLFCAIDCFTQAHNISTKATGEEAHVYQQYTSILRKANYICNHAYENTDEIKWELRNSIDSLESSKYMLKDYEIRRYNAIKGCLTETDELLNSILSEISSACEIYDRLEHYDKGFTWYAKEELETAKECEGALQRARLKADDLGCDLDLFIDTQNAISKVSANMQGCIDDELLGSRYYSESNFSSTYVNPYDDGSIDDLKTALNASIAKRFISALY